MKRLIVIALLIALPLLALRFIGEHKFQYTPTDIPASTVNQSTEIAQAVNALLDTATPAAESLFYPLANPHRALRARIHLADKATESIDLQYYLFHDDLAGQALLAAVIKAAERGVKIRLLLDDMDVPGREGLLSQLAASHDNISIRVFNPAWFRSLIGLEFIARFPRVTRRMHNKSFTVDRVATVVGGRNIGNEYFGVETEVTFSDLDVLAAGLIAKDTSHEFEQYWHSGVAYEVSSLGVTSEQNDYQKWLAALNTSLTTLREKKLQEDELLVSKLLTGRLDVYFDRGSLIYDNPNKVLTSLFDKKGHLAQKISGLMSSATQDLLISSPYFIPGAKGMEVFKELRERGVEVTILTNSLAANDVIAVHAGYMGYREELLRIGVKLYELKAINNENHIALLGSKNASLHAKTFVVDQRLNFIGSFNLDPRSAVHNTEMGVVFESAEYAQALYERLPDFIQKRAYKVTLAANDLKWHELEEEKSGVTYDYEPGSNLLQRVLVVVISWLPVDWLL